MNIYQKIKNYFTTPPVHGGRGGHPVDHTVKPVTTVKNASAGIQALEDFIHYGTLYSYSEFIEIIEKLAITNPDMSQTIKQSIMLGNTGHNVTFENLPESQSKKANQEIDEWASITFTRGGGIDGFVNDLFRQILISGAISVEWIPSMKLEGIEKAVLVPVKEIKFKKIGNEFIAYQYKNGMEIELNQSQYQYIPLQKGEDSPYGIPPFISSLNAIITQLDGFANIKHFLKKIGLLGMLSVKKEVPPRDYNKSETEWTDYLRQKLQEAAEGFKNNFMSGVAVHYSDTEIEHTDINANAQGAAEIWQLIEEQVASGLNIPPSLLGRTYSTTETYAGVIYSSFLANLENVRRIIKRVLERGYWLHLAMKGYPITRVKVTFNENESINAINDAQAENIKVQSIILKLQSGIIDVDTAAKELGYAKATGTPQQNAQLSSSPPLAGGLGGEIIPFAKKKAMM